MPPACPIRAILFDAGHTRRVWDVRDCAVAADLATAVERAIDRAE